MALIKCKECGKEISNKAKSCPNCGLVIKKQTSNFHYYVIGFLILFLIYMISSLVSNDSTKPDSGFSLPNIGTSIVTFDEYERIEVGMSYKQVVEIIGSDGEELSRNKIEGVPGVMESVETVMYQWMNKNGANMSVMFQNDKLIQKAQYGLK